MSYHGDVRRQAARMASRRWPFTLTWPTLVQDAPLKPAPRWIGPTLALAFCTFYALTYAGTLTSRDGGVMYDTALALLNRHTLALPPHHHGLPGVDGGFYSKYGIALSVAEIPLLVVGQSLAALAHSPLSEVIAPAITMLIVPIITALAVWLFFLLAYELRPDPRSAIVAALLLGVASPYWPYAKSDFSEPLSALSLTGAVLFLVRARARPGVATYALAGAFMALALLAKLTSGFVLPTIALYAVYIAFVTTRGAPRPAMLRLAAWAGPVALGLLLDALYNLARFGSLTDTGYHAEDLPFRAPLLTGLEGLLISSGKGLLWYCPLIVVALALWPHFLSRHRVEALLALSVVLITLVVFATYPVWWGGVCWGPRYLVPILPLALLPLALLRETWPRTQIVRQVVMAIVALSILVQGLGVAVHPARYLATGVADTVYLWHPDASPLLAHAWFAGYDVAILVGHGEAAALLPNYPWRHSNGVSLRQKLAIDGWPYWWWQVLHRNGLSRLIEAVATAVILLLLGLALYRLRAMLLPPREGRGMRPMAERAGTS